MFGTQQFNTTFNYAPVPLTVTEDLIVFNGYGLQNANIITQKFNADDIGNFEYNTFNIPRDDGKGFVSRYLRSKNIPSIGILKSDTNTNLNTLIDDFKKNMYQTQGILKNTVSGIQRQLKATCTNLTIERQHFNITFVTFKITFEINEPFFYNSQNQAVLFENVTEAVRTEGIENLGSVNSKPIIYFIFKSVVGTGVVSLNIGGVILTFTGSIITDDILVFDSLNKQVLLNGNDQDYSGTFPELIAGYNVIVYGINGTYTADISIIYRKNFV